MGHLERERTREEANIKVYAELFFLSFSADHHEEKNETVTQREPQIDQTTEERQSKKH